MSNSIDTRHDRPFLYLSGLFVVVVVAVTILLSILSAPAAAQVNNSTLDGTAPYYANESANVSSAAWFAGKEDPSMDDIVSMALRVGPYIIGTGQPLGGGAGYSGTLLLGLVVTGVFVGAVAGIPIGAAGVSVVALMAAYGFVEVGLAPAWLKIVVLFLLGTVAAVVAFRAVR